MEYINDQALILDLNENFMQALTEHIFSVSLKKVVLNELQTKEAQLEDFYQDQK